MVPARDGTALNISSPRLLAPLLMLGASLLFATMGVCVKLAAEIYPAGEIVFYRGLVGMLFAWLLSRSRGSSPWMRSRPASLSPATTSASA